MSLSPSKETLAYLANIKSASVITIAVEKGGAGKTTSAINIASDLARWGAICGWRVLLIDTDPQSTAANTVGQYSTISRTKNLAMLLNDQKELLNPHEFVEPSPWNPQHLHYIPTSRQSLGKMRETLISQPGSKRRLTRVLQHLTPDYQFVIIDSAPANDVLMQNALAAADYVLMPVNLDFLGLEAISRTIQLIQEVQTGLKQNTPEILGILGTFYRKRVLSSEESLKLLQENFTETLFDAVIPINSVIPDSFSASVDLHTFNKRSSSARAYSRVVQEIILRISNNQRQNHG
jgi:chromosome partitioning protein